MNDLPPTRADSPRQRSPAAALTRSAKLRAMLKSEALEFLLEAHNGLSARIVREAGFSGIWASGLSIAAQFGVRDNNEASWTQVVDMLEFMVDASDLPILLEVTPAMAISTTCAVWCASWNNAASPACASRTSSFRRPTAS